jgi:hypothetical protein
MVTEDTDSGESRRIADSDTSTLLASPPFPPLTTIRAEESEARKSLPFSWETWDEI